MFRVHGVEVHDQAEQVEVERTEHQVEDLALTWRAARKQAGDVGHEGVRQSAGRRERTRDRAVPQRYWA